MGIPVAGAANQYLTNLKQHQLADQVNTEQSQFLGSSIKPDLSQGYNAGFQDTLGTGSNYGWPSLNSGPGRLDLPSLGPTALITSSPPKQGGIMASTKKPAAGTTPAAPVSTGSSAVSGWVWLLLIIAALYFLD